MNRIALPFALLAAFATVSDAQAAPPARPHAVRAAAAAVAGQDRVAPVPGCDGGGMPASATGMVAIGPKQDDPVDPKPQGAARDSASGMASGRGMVAIGPKQDDPVDPKPQTRDAAGGMATGRAAVAIGPKQDDPAPPPSSVRCTPTTR